MGCCSSTTTSDDIPEPQNVNQNTVDVLTVMSADTQDSQDANTRTEPGTVLTSSNNQIRTKIKAQLTIRGIGDQYSSTVTFSNAPDHLTQSLKSLAAKVQSEHLSHQELLSLLKPHFARLSQEFRLPDKGPGFWPSCLMICRCDMIEKGLSELGYELEFDPVISDWLDSLRKEGSSSSASQAETGK